MYLLLILVAKFYADFVKINRFSGQYHEEILRKEEKYMKNSTQEINYKERYEEHKEELLNSGEYAIQMLNHHPAYFITNKAG